MGKKLGGYVDIYILPIPKKFLKQYKEIANRYAKIIKKHGALDFREFIGEDLFVKGMIPIPSKIKLKEGEVLISSLVEFSSKAHRKLVNKNTMNDPNMKKIMTEPMLFDMKRMLYGGFETIVKM